MKKNRMLFKLPRLVSNKIATTLFLFFILQSHVHADTTKNPRILFVYQAIELDMQQNGAVPDAFKLRGSSVCKLNQIEQLCRVGADVRILVMGDKQYAAELVKKGLHVYESEKPRAPKDLLQLLVKKMREIFKQDPFDLIHCNELSIVTAARKIPEIKKNNVKIVFTLHVEPKNCNYLKNIDGVLCVGPTSEKIVALANKKNNLGINVVDQIPPFFNVDRFLSFSPPTQTREDFFKKEFNVNLSAGPIISSVANFYMRYKNHTVLIKAIDILVHELKLPVNLILVGDGIRRVEMEYLSHMLNLENHIHFVGLTQKVPEINFYSDICTLTSDAESFGIALAEAALLKRPLIGTAGTGMEAIVLDGKTGFLFKKGSERDLAEKLAILVGNNELAKQLGENAYYYATSTFLPEVGVSKLLKFYQQVVTIKKTRLLITQKKNSFSTIKNTNHKATSPHKNF